MQPVRYKNGKPVYRVGVDGKLPAAMMGGTAHVAADLADRTMASWTPPAGSADADLLHELDTIVPRSRDLSRNNGILAGGHQTLKDNIIGSQLKLSSKPHYRLLGWESGRAEQWANATEAHFETWANTTECDVTRTHTLLGLTLQGLGAAFLNGEALAIPMWVPRPGASWGTRIMLIEADRLSTPPYLAHRPDVRGGVQYDRYGAPVAYYIQKHHPGDALSLVYASAGLIEWERVPAFTGTGLRRVLHLHDKERTGQSRGKPLVTAVMREFHMAGKYQTTELQAAIANSLIAAFLEADMGSEGLAELLGANSSGIEGVASAWKGVVNEYRAPLRGGAVLPLPPGAKLSPYTPNRPNSGFAAFMESSLRHIAAGMNMPYELLLKDFSKTNYSSARAALLEAWRYFQGRRRWIKDYWLSPIYELWMEEAVAAGRVEAPDFHRNRYAYCRARWVFSGRGWVDPVKEANAAKLRMEGGLSTLEDECAEQGLDWEEVLDQQARERARRADLGLPQPTPARREPETPEPTEPTGAGEHNGGSAND